MRGIGGMVQPFIKQMQLHLTWGESIARIAKDALDQEGRCGIALLSETVDGHGAPSRV
jgi:hypothetical protein